MKRITVLSIIIAAGLLALATNKRTAAQPSHQPAQTQMRAPIRASPQQVPGQPSAFAAQTQGQARPAAATRSQAVVLQAQEYYTYGQIATNAWTNSYAGLLVYNSSSSAGAPTFPNAAYLYTSGYFTNEFGQVQQGQSTETTEPVQLADAVAQLMDDGFRIVSVQTPGQQYGYGPTQLVLVKSHE